MDHTPSIPEDFRTQIEPQICPVNNENNAFIIPKIQFSNTDWSLVNLPPISVNDNNKFIIPKLPSNDVAINIFEPPKIKKNNKFESRGERICRTVLEKIYGCYFENQRPNWLTNPETNRQLELDGYNSDLEIAFEYNGQQHYVWPNFTNQSYEEFIGQLRRDRLKKELCQERGVYLIIIPYTVNFDQIESYIISLLPETIQRKIQQEYISHSIGVET
jgi:hypothetical protein